MKRKGFSIFIFCLTILMTCGSAFSQPAIEQGTNEVNFMLSFTNTEMDIDGLGSEDANMFTMAASWGYFITDMNELGVNTALTIQDLGFDTLTAVKGSVFYTLNFVQLSEMVVPYIGGQFGFATMSNGGSESGLTWAAYGGLRLLVSENVSLNIQPGYYMEMYDGADLTIIAVSGGFSILF